MKSESIVVIDYGIGNLGSIVNMLKKAGADARISADPGDVRSAEKLILAGVGAFDNGMRNLAERGLLEVLNERAASGTPVLGLCLGMQMLGRRSAEGTLPGLGWIDGESRRFDQALNPGLKVPHMGWNTIALSRPHPLFQGLDDDSRFYFVHSYYVACDAPEQEIARTRYGHDFTSAVGRGNVMGVQFHPEKSHRFGMKILANFAERC